MLEPMRESDNAVPAFRAGGVLTQEDYQNVLVPRLKAALIAGERIRLLIFIRGWNARAAWANTCLDLRHRRDFDKVAIVGAPIWEEWCVKAANLLIAGQLKTFKREQLDDAWTWLRG